MAIPSYENIPVHGFEPWLSIEGKTFSDNAGAVVVPENQALYGGGAKITNENLVIGLWTIITEDANGNPVTGAQIRPFDSFPDLNAATGIPTTTLLSQVFDSRISAKVGVTPSGEFPADILAVIAPPPGFKNRLQRALTRFDTATSISEGNVNKSLIDQFVWAVTLGNTSGGFLGPTESVNVVIGSALGAFGGPNLLSTSGADGEYPLFLPNDSDSLASLQATQAALESGKFYVPIRFSWDDGAVSNIRFDVTYPASATR